VLLKAVAERFARLLHEDDLLARLDSDEFGCSCRGFAHARGRGARSTGGGRKIAAALREAITVDGEAIHVDASIGIVLMPESPNESAADVLRQADRRWQEPRRRAAERSLFFEVEMGEAVKSRFQLEAELRAAIVGNQFGSTAAAGGCGRQPGRARRWCAGSIRSAA